MNNSRHFKSFNKVFTLLGMVSILFFSSCGNDDEATPDCSNLEITATAEGNTITVSATGGAAPYVYTLNNEVQSGTTFTDLEPGSYTMVVTDANECSDSENVEINLESVDCSNLELSATVEGSTITASATGGDGPYVFSLNGEEQSGTSFTDLEPGTYAVIVTDANVCSVSQNVTIVDPCVGFTLTASGAGYAVAIEIEEGEGPFNIVIAYGETEIDSTSAERSFTVDLDEAEETTITITDAIGCEQQSTLTAEQVRTFTDIRDGQTYQTIKIGNQIWFAENFNYETEEDSYCYDNDPANCETYGRLYTWDATLDIAPTGWRLPSESDFERLNTFLGDNAGTKLQVGGESGFEAKLAGGWINSSTSFEEIKELGFFWTTTEFDVSRNVLFRVSVNTTSFFKSNTSVDNGISVRLLKN